MNDIDQAYGKLKNNSKDLYLMTDLSGNLMDMNQCSTESLEINGDKNFESYNLKDFLINIQDWDNYCQRMETSQSQISGLDITLRKRDGSILTGLLSSCLYDKENIKYRVFIIHNISAYMEASNEAVKLNLELLDKNNQLNDAYMTMSHQEKLASLGELSAGVAHEINNPLAFVSSNLKSLLKYTKRIFSYKFDFEDNQREEFNFIKEDLESLFEETREGLERIENITKSLKRFSRMDEDSKTSAYDLNKAIEDTVIISKNQCPQSTELILDLHDLPLIQCFANDINQVLLNMVINGLQAQSEMSRDYKGYLKIITRSKSDKVQLIFEDNGPGVSKEIERKIYDPFFTTKDIGKGTGLGLGLCFNIINNKHKGALWLESRKDPTRFVINIPTNLEES